MIDSKADGSLKNSEQLDEEKKFDPRKMFDELSEPQFDEQGNEIKTMFTGEEYNFKSILKLISVRISDAVQEKKHTKYITKRCASW